MEKHAVSARLDHTRERIRAMLVPDAETGRIESKTFPRSAVMRWAFDPKARSVAMAGLSLMLMLKGRRSRARSGVASILARSLGTLLTMARR